MKINKIIIIFCFTALHLFAQDNLIYNPGFENGPNSPKCDYGIEQYDQALFIDNDIYDWKRATCSGFAPFYKCTNQYSYPDWMECSCGSKKAGLNCYSRFVYLDKTSDKGHQDAIRTGLVNKMGSDKNYLFRITYAGVSPKSSQQPDLSARTRIYFTKYSTNWSANWGNSKLSFVMYPPSDAWFQHWFPLNGPILNSIPYVGDLFSKLSNIAIDCEQGEFYIDYVELSESCANPILIENHQFNFSIDELPYKSSGILRAGYDVGSSQPNGDVVVRTGANETFKAATSISLEPGFIVESGANFNMVIEPCDIYNPNKTNSYNIQAISDKEFLVSDGVSEVYVYNDATETIDCNADTIKIYGLDGDTTSYINYQWDYGNGITSNDKVAKLFYTQPGSYLVKLAITDSLGVTDTLTKTYIKPPCGNNINQSGDGIAIGKTNEYNNSAVSIIPNPNSGSFNISINDFDEKNTYNLSITNYLGQIVKEKRVTSNITSIDISNEPSGIYFLNFVSDKGLQKIKIIKQ